MIDWTSRDQTYSARRPSTASWESVSSVDSTAWDAPSDLQPCWDIWAPLSKEHSKFGLGLSPPYSHHDESRFWPSAKPATVSAQPQTIPHNPWRTPSNHLASPPLTPQTSPLQRAVSIPSQGELAALVSAGDSPLYIVQFKGGRLEVFCGAPNVQHHVNEIVIVDADRGQDVGQVIATNVSPVQAGYLKWRQHQERQHVLSLTGAKESLGPPNVHSPNFVLRSATPAEISQMTAKTADEAKALALCAHKIRERNLDMVVVDAEYQWDRRKLTFFYRVGQRVDFRDLVRDLFRTYKTRIWMCAVGTNGNNDLALLNSPHF